MRSLRLSIAAAFMCLAYHSASADETVRMFGHEVSVVDKDSMQKLIVDGHELIEDQYIDFTQFELISGVPAMVGSTSAGGNACAARRFVLSFPSGKNPRLDGPVDSCLVVTVDPLDDRINFTAPANMTNAGETWEWTPEGGLKKTGEFAYQPEDGGWDTLRERTQKHPFDVVKLREISDQIKDMLGGDAETFMAIMQGVGSGEFDGSVFSGTSCQPHLCGTVEGLLVADTDNRKLYLAWKEEGQKIKVSPTVKQWHGFAKEKLREWAKTWE